MLVRKFRRQVRKFTVNCKLKHVAHPEEDLQQANWAVLYKPQKMPLRRFETPFLMKLILYSFWTKFSSHSQIIDEIHSSVRKRVFDIQRGLHSFMASHCVHGVRASFDTETLAKFLLKKMKDLLIAQRISRTQAL